MDYYTDCFIAKQYYLNARDAIEEAEKAMWATSEYKDWKKAEKAMWATPEYKDWKKAEEAVMATSEYKALAKARVKCWRTSEAYKEAARRD